MLTFRMASATRANVRVQPLAKRQQSESAATRGWAALEYLHEWPTPKAAGERQPNHRASPRPC